MSAPIEPGVLRLFRWYAGVCFGLLALVALTTRGDNPPDPPQYPAVGLVLFGLLFLLLSIPQAQRRFRSWYLPIAIVLATLAPIFGSAATVSGRLADGLSPNESLSDYWIPFFMLFVPFLITAWQYRFRWVVAFALGSTILDLVTIAAVFQPYETDLTALGALIVARGLLFVFIGLFLSKLVARQRELQSELRDAALASEQIATARERNRLARELHDTLAHAMTGTVIQLEAAGAVWDQDLGEARALVERALEGTRTGLAEARRAIEDLRASPLEDLGLAGALSWLADDANSVSEIEVGTSIHGDTDDLSASLEQAAYRIAEESLVNAVRHADASHANIALRVDASSLELSVHDDGKGFDAEAVPDGRHGLQGMFERADLVGGTVDVESAPGEGTTVRLVAPRRV